MREERGRSLRATAEDLGVAPSHLSRLERGEKAPSEELIHRAAIYYGIDDDVVALASGRIPQDVLAILLAHPEALADLRQRYAEGGR
jgi:transcriptional regulator with XRE-family HTH domain